MIDPPSVGVVVTNTLKIPIVKGIWKHIIAGPINMIMMMMMIIIMVMIWMIKTIETITRT
jgi:hypothetical protein